MTEGNIAPGAQKSTTSRRGLLGGAAFGAAAITVPAVGAAPHSDVDLIRLCASAEAAELAVVRHGYFDATPGTADYCRLARENDMLAEQSAALMERVAKTPARTIDGLRAKASAIWLFCNLMMPEDETPGANAIHSLLRDLMGRAA